MLLRSEISEVCFTPSLTGVGERAHLATPETNLETHILDVLAVIQMEDLVDITLIGHSYGGIVATGVADRARDRIAQLIYLDTFVSESGKSLYELIGRPIPIDADWRVPPRPIPRDTSESDTRWIEERRTAQPLRCSTSELHLANEDNLPPRAYIRCTRTAPDDPMRSSVEPALRAGWKYIEIYASHNPHVTAPGLLANAIMSIVAPDTC